MDLNVITANPGSISGVVKAQTPDIIAPQKPQQQTTQAPQTQSNTDKQALNLAHAIALAESGSSGKPNYNAVGDNGLSVGAYQWYSKDGGISHFKSDAKSFGLNPEDFSPENQDKVAYTKIKTWKDKGYQPAEIASMWNSGSPNNYENHSGTNVINGKAIHYDTPAYVKRVQKYYEQLSKEPEFDATPFSSPNPGEIDLSGAEAKTLKDKSDSKKPGILKSLIQGVTNPFARAGVELYNVGSGVNKVLQGDVKGANAELDKSRDLGYLGKVNPTLTNSKKPGFKQAIDVAGQGIELGTDFAGVGAGEKVIKNAGEQGVKQLIKQGAKEGALLGGTQGFGHSLSENTAPGNDSFLTNKLTNTAIQTGEGALGGGLIGGLIGGVSGAIKGLPWSQLSKDDAAKATWDLIQPEKPNPGSLVNKKTLTGTESSVIPNSREVEMIQVAKPYIKPNDPIGSWHSLSSAAENEASQLRDNLAPASGTWSEKNLQGAINKTKIPLAIKNTAEMTQVKNINDFVMELANGVDRDAGGTLDLSKVYRQQINNEYGENIWGKDTPIANYIKNLNHSLNDFTVSRLPEGKTPNGDVFKDIMKKISLLYNARDNISLPKVGKQTSTNIVGKLAKPVGGLLKRAADYVGAGEVIKHVIP